MILKPADIRFELMPKFFLFFVFFSAYAYETTAQVRTYPLETNPRLVAFHNAHPTYAFQPNAKNKFGQRDTLELPFFDDFSQSTLYPDSTLWLNNQVYVNNQFPLFPPTLNVATFDVLDAQGVPYRNTINKDLKDAGDSLISQPINLSSTVYSLSDSIVLSFFYQPNGNGYHLNGEDIIRLWFKAKNGLWFQVWSKEGENKSVDFEQVMITVLDSNYLHAGFQFMFTTYTRQVGNANHWHIDYVVVDKNRSVTIKTYDDYAIQTTPTSLLKDYWAMPYDHFSTNPSSFMSDSVRFWVSNLSGVDRRLQVRNEAVANGSQVASTSFLASSNNHAAQDKRQRNLPIYSIANVPNTGEVEVKRTVELTESIPNDVTVNDKIEFTQVLHDYYAYDDGSAEQNFGFEQTTNPSNIEGQVAYGFEVVKKDTLYALATYFNQAVFDGSRNRFRYRVWSELKGINGGLEDVVIYESDDMTPTYSSANGQRTFTPHLLDTILVLEPGKYYIGWWQGSIFNLNIGWDMNYGNTRNPQRKNPNLFAKAFGDWSNDVPQGTLMMRPHFGSKRPLYASTKRMQPKEKKPTIYPNPAHNVVYLGKKYAQIKLVNFQGQEVFSAQEEEEISVRGLREGMYFAILTNEKGEQFSIRLVILAP